MTRAAVYQHLNELSEKGLIVGYEEGGKRFFRVSEKGRRALVAFDDLKFLM
jgi:DNA-binding PadR family transcriptional regulator